LVSTHWSPHASVPEPQTVLQAPDTQNCPVGQTLPQEPQFFGSFLASTHFEPQAISVAAHELASAPSVPASLPL